KLVLDFAGDGDLALEALALALLLDGPGNRHGHLVERAGQRAELVVADFADAEGKVAGPDPLGGFIEIADGASNRAREDHAGEQRSGLDDQEQPAHGQQENERQAAEVSERSEEDV